MMEAPHDAKKSKENMMNFSGSAGDMLAAMEAAGINVPDAKEAAKKAAAAPASVPEACTDPSCTHDHSHGSHEHDHGHAHDDGHGSILKHGSGDCCGDHGSCSAHGHSHDHDVPPPPGGWPAPPPPPRLESAGSVIHCSSDAAYSQALAKAGTDRLVVVDCYADWCGPCRAISPTVDALAKEYLDVVFVKLDVDACPSSARGLRIMAMPTFVFLKNGSRIGSFMGANESLLRQGLESEGKVGGICSMCVLQ
jgi:thioredoxin 1